MDDQSPDDKDPVVPSSMIGMGGKQDPAKSSRRARRAGGVEGSSLTASRLGGYKQPGK
jgi:hypothetical protein